MLKVVLVKKTHKSVYLYNRDTSMRYIFSSFCRNQIRMVPTPKRLYHTSFLKIVSDLVEASEF